MSGEGLFKLGKVKGEQGDVVKIRSGENWVMVGSGKGNWRLC